jgi:hypothetical protein
MRLHRCTVSLSLSFPFFLRGGGVLYSIKPQDGRRCCVVLVSSMWIDGMAKGGKAMETGLVEDGLLGSGWGRK